MSSHIEPGMDQIVGQLDLCNFVLITVSYFCRRPKMRWTQVKQARTK